MKISSVERLYHGTDRQFERFDFACAKKFKDFGKGFYLTTSLAQAQNWAQNKAGTKQVAFVYSYKVDSTSAEKCKILELLQYDQEWLDFIVRSRLDAKETDYDIIYDRMADNLSKEMSKVLRQYRQEKMTAAMALQRIEWKKRKADQYCFKTEKALSALSGRETIILHKNAEGNWESERG